MIRKPISRLLLFTAALLVLGAYGASQAGGVGVALSDAQIEALVRRTYQYVAMYNVNNKFALKQGGWNTVVADTRLGCE